MTNLPTGYESIGTLRSIEAGRVWELARMGEERRDYAECEAYQPEIIEFEPSQPECYVRLYGDGSLIVVSNGDDEVWAEEPAGLVRASPPIRPSALVSAPKERNEIMTTSDLLACVRCAHKIEAHQPGDYDRDVCVALGYKKPYGGVCPCDGFAIRRSAP